ncbi:hypothetical protein Cgig2_016669 [Carnegiea gigantea]|uniref:Photolyase/cryptochrome alpha/beta domain-containing protein n=1 Tax=Carnegiea gigantea TaxID=171969 RepID=A0A9Q1L065_9CARY|nr:hypothetical protein Cgig2_016669 [Carnegiea gigantea]
MISNASSQSELIHSNPSSQSMVYRVPGFDPDEIDYIAGQTFRRYTLSPTSNVRRTGNGTCIVWFRNDLRVLDNQALFKAWVSSDSVLPVYCVDPRLFGATYYFGLPKTGALRAQFLVECLADLRKNLQKYGLDLLIRHGKPEEVLPSLAESFGAHTIYAHNETCSEELRIEARLLKALQKLSLPSTPVMFARILQSVESKCMVRSCIKTPASLGPPPKVEDWGSIPSLDQFELQHQKASRPRLSICRGRKCIVEQSARVLLEEGGPRRLEHKWSQDPKLFESWREGKTGYPLIDANMKELSATGFMSNRGRQIVCSFLVRDMGIDWRMGAEWFETCLLDYDPCSNYGNWTYGAGVGNDPREDRYFSIPKQAQVYDPDGEYVAYWLPELRRLPKDKQHFPGFSYLKPVVPLKYGNPTKQGGQSTAAPSRKHSKFASGHGKPHRG